MFTRQPRTALMQALNANADQHPHVVEFYEKAQPLILEAFNAQRLCIFQRRSHNKDLVSFLKTGTEIRELKLPINTLSVAGYVAMAQRPITVDNPYDEEELASLHPKLRFEKKYDRLARIKTDNILAVPIKQNGVLLGVLQLVNKASGPFDQDDIQLANAVAEFIGDTFKFELGGTARPFDYLIYKGVVDGQVFANIPKSASIKHLANLLINDYQVPEEQVIESLSVYYQIPAIEFDPKQYHVARGNLKLNPSYLKRNNVAILRDIHDHPIVLMFEPHNSILLMEIENALGYDHYQVAFALPSNIEKYLGKGAENDSNISKFDEIMGEISSTEIVTKEKKSEHINEDEPAIARLVSSILMEAKRLNASDIHIDPEPNSPTLVRMRVDGLVRDINEIPVSHHNAVISRIKIMSGLNIAEKRMPQDGKLVINVSGENIDVRVATIPTVIGESMVMRILAGGNALPLTDINLSTKNVKTLESILSIPHGIILVVGPTGSGKTTTLHALLGHLNTPDKKIWTIEDPVEITQYRLQQVQVNPKIGFTFATALRAFLRADPDVILVGEMRDKETAGAAIEASLTGHLVLSTLHTNSAPETITRLLDLGMDPVNFSDACIGILAQRLVRLLCINCKEKHTISDVEFAFFKRHYGEAHFDELGLGQSTQIYKAKGCSECDNTGYKGRTAVHELLVMTPELRSLVYKESTVAILQAQALKDGMRTLAQDALKKILNGDTDIAQIQALSGNSTINY